MIRQTAFEGTQPLLKGGLHCHTTRSDGLLSPEEVIRLHGRYGYDFLALTDHRIYNRTDYAPDSGVLILPGMEMDRLLALPGRRWFHTVCLGPAGDPPFAQDERFESGVVDDAEAYQPLLDSLHAAGFLTIYCHPEWSMTPARLFEKQRGNFAMEIWNSGCVLENGLDGNAAYWDELLLQGIRIFGVATDDGHARHHHGNGWVRVRAEKNVPDILRALREGAFYASCGPELHDFYIADGKAVVCCSPAERVAFRCGNRPLLLAHAGEGALTRAEIPVPEAAPYLRAEVGDAQGRKAWTNPIFLS